VRRRVARAANPYTLRARSDAVKMQRGQHRAAADVRWRVEVLLVVAGAVLVLLTFGLAFTIFGEVSLVAGIA